MKQAVIDIGSNSIRLTLYETEAGHFKTLFREKIMAGLAGYVEAAVDGDVICAIGDEARIEDAKDAFTEVKSVF